MATTGGHEQYVQLRRKRYLAQVLDSFEKEIQPHLPAGTEGQVQDFKGLCRARFNALAVDAIDLMNLGGDAINGAGQDVKDRLEPTGRPRGVT